MKIIKIILWDNLRLPRIILPYLILISLDAYSQENPWENIGPYMGYINSMDMDNNHPDTVYAATLNGLYRTFDGAENWIDLNLPEKEINKVVVSQKESNKILCTSEYKVYFSNDYGINWDMIFFEEEKVEGVTFNPENPKTVLVGTKSAGNLHEDEISYFYRSINGGLSWNQINFDGVSYRDFPYSIKYLIIDPSDTLKIYIGTENYLGGGMFVSHNNGADWINVELAGSNEEVYALVCTPKEYEDHTVCAIATISTAPDVFDRKLYISKNGGITWVEKDPPSSFDLLDNVNVESTMYISKDYPKYIYIGADYNYDGGSTSVVAFNIEGETWHYWPDCPNNFPSSILTCNEADYLGFSDKGVYKYMGNYMWLEKNKGFSSGEILDLAYYPETPEKMLVAIEDNFFKTDDFGQSWKKLGETSWNKNSIFIRQSDTTKIIAGTAPENYLTYGSNFYIYKSNSGGKYWNSQVLFTRYGNIMYDYKMWISEIVGSPEDPNIIYIGVDGGDASAGSGFYRSIDGGENWEKEYTTGVSAIAVDPVNSNIIYLGTTAYGYVSRSEDAGDTWTRISPEGNDYFVISVWDLAVDKNQQVFAATTSGLFKWEGNENWVIVPSFPITSTTVIAIDNSLANPVYYVGTSGNGIYRSDNGGETWESFNTGLGSPNIIKLKINDSYPKYLYAGTQDRGAWTTLLEESSTIQTEEYISICQGEEYEGYNESTTFQRILTSAAGTDSIVTTYLTVNPNFEIEEYVSICEGEEYLGLTEAGDHLRNFETVNDCDSIMVTHLSVNATYASEESVSICEGDNYLGLTKEGDHQRAFESIDGCDSIVVTHLVFYPPFKPIFEIEEDTLTSLELYSGYQWFDENGIIEGATGQKYIIGKSGDYYLRAQNENGCFYNSDTIFVRYSTSWDIGKDGFTYSVMPNPNNGSFLFRIDQRPPEKLTLKLLNTLGQEIETRQLDYPEINKPEQFNVFYLSKGIYHLVIYTDNFKDDRKIVVN